jgi:cell division protein FtsN
LSLRNQNFKLIGFTVVVSCMGKQHDTFPEEKQEMPVPNKETPEINQPSDPDEPEAPQEDLQVVPDEFPPDENSPDESPGKTDIYK